MQNTKSSIHRRRVVLASIMASSLVLVMGVVGVSARTTPRTSSALTVATAKSSQYGTILISGNTLYTLKPSKVACSTKCLQSWPQVLLPKGVTKATAGAGVKSSKLGKIKLKSGRYQVTYAGKALYWFVLDTAPGQVNGVLSDTWGKWSVYVTAKPTTTTTTTTPTTTTTVGGGIGF